MYQRTRRYQEGGQGDRVAAMDPGEYVFTLDGRYMVCLHSGIDPRAARVWDAVLSTFIAMGGRRAQVAADAWRLQHDPQFHHTWAVCFPLWCPTLAYYTPVDGVE